MTIGIDIRMLASNQKSGIEEYVENLLAHMLPANPQIRFKLFYSSFRKPLPQYDWVKLKNVTLYNYKIPNNILFIAGRLFGWPKIDRMIDGVDIFFSPHFFLAPLSKNCRRVTTIHDLSFDIFPEYFSFRQKLWHKFEMTPAKQARLSDKIIAVSESTKEDLSRYYDIDPAKVEIVYSGISTDLTRPTTDELDNFRRKNNLPEQFMLFLGKLEPRKNVSALVRAFDILKKDSAYDNMHLIIAGSKGWLCDELNEVIRLSPFASDIIVVGHVKDADRKYYYSLASVFVYPSFFEGFGFPPLEAMACSTPVITSNRSSLGEVVGNFGICINPDNIAEISHWTGELIDNKELRIRMVEGGLRHSRTFCWSATARKTLDIIINA
jgi:glycosyltransferase involved in cell wall biosynthesis